MASASGVIAPHYPKAGRPPMPLETILRVYFLRNRSAVSDPMAEGTSVALMILKFRTLSRLQAETLGWMVDLIDRIGESDISGK